ncbi:hypothetical protein HDU92_001669 [Lobulomyces angularis]|nr:hypothetical protein HDU92_001669 [Lobulomyces angularis]
MEKEKKRKKITTEQDKSPSRQVIQHHIPPLQLDTLPLSSIIKLENQYRSHLENSNQQNLNKDLNRKEVLEKVQQQFSNQNIDEKESVAFFIYSLKNKDKVLKLQKEFF